WEKQKGSRGIRRGQWYRLVFQFPIREHNISQPIGPRELLLSAKIGMMRGDFVTGIERSFINKLPSASAQAAREVVQKIFG
ncbi:hypothetical protein MZD80_15015, partial [Escherichia coli]|nr:hypothetical protein [Escherichia coli]